MQKDPRSRNTFFKSDDIERYLKEYAGAISYALNRVDPGELEKAKDLMRLTLARAGRIFVGGNGGSAAISDHLCCDFVKGTYTEKYNNPMVHSLNASTALFTAIANDFSYKETFSFQLKAANINSNDILILISSSGNSPNIVEALKYAKERCAPVIGMTGFAGGVLKECADVKLHVPINNYGVIEDCHQALMHVMAQFHYVSFNDDK